MTVAGQRDRTDGELLRKILVTGATGLFTFAGSAALDGVLQIDLADQLILTAIVGGVTLLAQFLVDFERRITDLEADSITRLGELAEEQSRNIEEARRVIDRGFQRISEATSLYTEIESSGLRTEALQKLVHRSAHIDGSSPPLVRDLAQREIERVSELLRALSHSHDHIYEGEEHDLLLGLTQLAQATIDTTSLMSVDGGADGYDGGIWTSDFGRRYLDLQRAATGRGVRIRRVFVFDRPGRGVDETFWEIHRLQQDAGVDVRVLLAADLPGHYGSGLFDFIVFDRVLSYETTPSASTLAPGTAPAIVTTRLVLDERVGARLDRFDTLWNAASEVTSRR